jgi:hypothetical protein
MMLTFERGALWRFWYSSDSSWYFPQSLNVFRGWFQVPGKNKYEESPCLGCCILISTLAKQASLIAWIVALKPTLSAPQFIIHFGSNIKYAYMQIQVGNAVH